jgi:hypothetical protein
VNSLDHFRYIVEVEAERLVAMTPRTGETFVRKALADTIERLNNRLRGLGGTPAPSRRFPSVRRGPVRFVALSQTEAPAFDASTLEPEFGNSNPARMHRADDTSGNDALDELVSTVAADLNLNPLSVLQATREQRYSYARQMCMHLAYSVFGMSSTRIARYFGKRDHTTVLYGRDRIQDDLDTGKIDPVVWADLTLRVRAIGEKHGLIRLRDGRACNDVPELVAVPT